ncbi:MAG: hypothetical protein MUO85_09690 [candidate division Zixibacteria bacterium]|nr:hypothetical protein [candidate division Zixibacteria bacterium]
MKETNLNIKQTEKEIVLALQEELFYHQAVTDILTKQQDVVRKDSLEKLDQLFGQMRKEQLRIEESRGKFEDLTETLYASGIIPCLEINKLMNQIEKVISINLTLLKEIEKLTIFKRDKIKLELKNIANSRQLSKYGRTIAPLPQFVDKRN